MKEPSFQFTSHTQTISSLTPSTLYHYRVRSTNQVGKESISGDYTFTTAASAPAPTPAPALPTPSPTGVYHAPPPTSSLVVNVKDKGAKGDGVTLDAVAIQAAINQVGGTGGTVLVPPGTYLITHQTSWPYPSLILKSNMTFKMESGAVIKMKPTSSGTYTHLRIAGVSNVNVIGGLLMGERHQHIPTTYNFANTLNADGTNPGGEYGYGIWVDEGARNVYIDGVTAKEMWGDAFTIGGAGGGRNYNVHFYNVVAEDNRRQGLSIAEADGVVVRDSKFNNTRGAWPQCGIDIEPMGDFQFVDRVLIENVQLTNNGGCGLILASNQGRHHINYVTVKNCTVTGNRWGLSWLNPGIGSSFTNCTITGNSVTNIEY